MKAIKKLKQRIRELFCRHDALKWRAGDEAWHGECIHCGKRYTGRVINQRAIGYEYDPTEGYDA